MTTVDNPPPARKPRRRFILAFLVLLIVGAGGLVWWLQTRNFETTDDAFIDVHMARIAPQIAGRVIQVPIDDNQEVKAGDLLAEIDPADYQAKLDQAVANQAAVYGFLSQTKAQVIAALANVEEAQAEIDVAEANSTNAATQFARNQQLAQKKIISQQQLDDSSASTKSNTATLDAAHKKKVSSEAQVKVSESQVLSAEAAVKSADAQVEQAQLNLSYTKIVAPQDGRVTQKNVTVGDYLQTGQSIMVLVPKEVWVTANYKETQLNDIHSGQKVDITIDAYPDHTFQGHVDSIVSGGGAAFSLLPPENATGNYIKIVQRVPVKITFDEVLDEKYHLGPGMSVVPSIHIK